MQVVQNSAEHHFLTLLEKMKSDPGGWVAIHCAFSRKIEHEAFISNLSSLPEKLDEIGKESTQTLMDLNQKAGAFDNAVLYQFSDGDLILLFQPKDASGHDAFYGLFKDISATIKSGLIDFIHVGRDLPSAQKLADRKLLAQRRMDAYQALSDINKVASIPIRRQRRDEAIVMIVEDDRFTAAYTTTILNKDYDVVHARNGEEAIISYIENAPDIVFLDIHLPGLDGLETLHAIRSADSHAYVVIVSVDTVQNNIVTASERGAAGFLKKPFSKDRIAGIVEKSPFIKGSKSLLNRA
jgi:CheY-like chemotaxis protein